MSSIIQRQDIRGVFLPVSRSEATDVVVVGGGVAGCCAALAAACQGVQTLLVEQQGTLGGLASLGLVTPAGSRASRGGISFGGLCEAIFNEVQRLSREYGKADSDTASAPHILKYVLLDMLTKAGVKLQLHSRLIQVEHKKDRIVSVVLHTKSGIKEIHAPAFVDATGDGDLVCLSGDRYAMGCEPDAFRALVEAGLDVVHDESDANRRYRPAASGNGMQPVSSMFVMGGVDEEKAAPFKQRMLRFADLSIDPAEFSRNFYYGSTGFEANADQIPLPQGRVLFFRSARRGEVVVNMSRVIGIDATDEAQLTQGEIAAQQQVIALVDFLKRYVPGFENSYLIESSWVLGIRETRRLVGCYVLSGADVISCRRFSDTVAHGSYIIDIHDPYGKRKAVGGAIRGDCYSIPCRCLISSRFRNLAVAGRLISADHVAHSSTRIQGTCMMTGQAAGTMAALCAGNGTAFSAVEVPALQAQLRKQGVYLDSASAETDATRGQGVSRSD